MILILYLEVIVASWNVYDDQVFVCRRNNFPVSNILQHLKLITKFWLQRCWKLYQRRIWDRIKNSEINEICILFCMIYNISLYHRYFSFWWKLHSNTNTSWNIYLKKYFSLTFITFIQYQLCLLHRWYLLPESCCGGWR